MLVCDLNIWFGLPLCFEHLLLQFTLSFWNWHLLIGMERRICLEAPNTRIIMGFANYVICIFLVYLQLEKDDAEIIYSRIIMIIKFFYKSICFQNGSWMRCFGRLTWPRIAEIIISNFLSKVWFPTLWIWVTIYCIFYTNVWMMWWTLSKTYVLGLNCKCWWQLFSCSNWRMVACEGFSMTIEGFEFFLSSDENFALKKNSFYNNRRAYISNYACFIRKLLVSLVPVPSYWVVLKIYIFLFNFPSLHL